MAAQLPETSFERMTAEARDKERLDRQKMLVSLPKSKPDQEYLAAVASKIVDLREAAEDLVLVANEETVEALKVRLVQGTRAVMEQAAKLHSMSLVAAKEGPDMAQKIFIPAPTYGDLGEEETKLLEKYRKEKENTKKKEAAELSKSSWKSNNNARTTPYKSGYGGGYSGYGGGGGINSWAIQQLLMQQLTGKAAESGQAKGGAGSSGTAGGSGQQAAQDGGYAARIAMARIQYPCHACGIMGHWKKDGVCKPADIAAHIKNRMAEQRQKDKEDDEESGMCKT